MHAMHLDLTLGGQDYGCLELHIMVPFRMNESNLDLGGYGSNQRG